MKNLVSAIMVLMFFVIGSSYTFSQTENKDTKPDNTNKHGNHFIDLNNDGYNDDAPDADGDGIPNGRDADYTPNKKGNGKGFVDLNGDGINDNAFDADGDGIPNGKDPDFVKPQDGSGKKHMKSNHKFGNGEKGFGAKDGSGKGNGKGNKNGGGHGSKGRGR